jgi:calcineurin-like phosphoesterase family protein
MKNKIYFISDTHFNHTKIIQYCNRPFKSAEEMNETIIANWNARVQPGDTIFHLGDFGWGNTDLLMRVFRRLQGNKFLIKGNHDQDAVDLPWAGVFDMKEVKADGKVYQLCHYPLRSWNKSFHGARHLFGHCHGTLSPHGWSCDAGVDCWNFAPVSLQQLDNLFEKLPRDGQGQPMPRGVIWHADRHMQYGFKDFFIGDGSMDNVDPDEFYKKDNANPDVL